MAADQHDFLDYAFSKQVVTDYPKLIAMFDKMQTFLQEYDEYRAVHHVVLSIEEARTAMVLQYEHYFPIYRRKGLKKNVNK